VDNPEVHSTAARHKSSKMSRLSAPLPGSPKTPTTGAISAKASMKREPKETSTPTSSENVEEGSSKRPWKACDKASCVRVGLKPRCFVGATPR